jgi:hypothetical protein
MVCCSQTASRSEIIWCLAKSHRAGSRYLETAANDSPVNNKICATLARIGCPRTGEITQRAIDALHLPTLSLEAIDAVMADEENEEELNECNASYYKAGEDIVGQLACL